MSSLEWSRVSTPKGASVRVLAGGSGPDLVYLHGAAGLEPDQDFLTALSTSYRVSAPELPGFGESTGEELLEDMLDFTLHGWDVVRALGISSPILAGHSMGGMMAAEMAAVCPSSLSRLVLLSPLGLWLDEAPVADLFATLPHNLPELLFHDPAAGQGLLTGGLDFSDDTALVDFFVGNARRLGTAGKILFPIPDRRLCKRLYRMTADTLLVWGSSDRLVQPTYAKAWQAAIPSAALVTVPDAGHMLTVEKPSEVADHVTSWLA